ncbi:hypothetical protein Aperf_G00000054418 [Anoplocephala perfoliata]
MLTKFGVILTFGTLDAGGCIMTISFQIRTGSTTAGKGTGHSVAGYDGSNNNGSGLREEILSSILVHTSLFGAVLDDDDEEEEEKMDDAVENADMDDALLGKTCEEFTALANCEVHRERVKTAETANTTISAVSEVTVTAQSQNQPIVASVDMDSPLHIHRYGYPSSQEWEEDEEPESDMDEIAAKEQGRKSVQTDVRESKLFFLFDSRPLFRCI